MYSCAREGFGDSVRDQLGLLQPLLGLALTLGEARRENQRIYREVTRAADIGRAAGMLMATRQVGTEDALGIMGRAAQRQNEPLARVAAGMVESFEGAQNRS